MKLEENKQLQSYNTFSISATARYFSSFINVDELEEILSNPFLKNKPQLVLGGGSNILFTGNFDGLVLKNEIEGIALVKEDKEAYYIKAGAGVPWHSFVLHCINNNYAGIENLSLIPGNVGASPMQNIG